ncbi:MAG: sn-glycerol-3-phosphate ABC transporter substrate-binding protein UgpB [Vulcanimicrobiaceae bacterium]
MLRRTLLFGVLVAAMTASLCGAAGAATEIPFWHSMESELGVRVDEIAAKFNASQSDYKVVPIYKGNYEQSLAAGIAASRAGDAPAILQVYEVGTATMMHAGAAIKPVYQVFADAGVPLDVKEFVPAIASYYSEGKEGHLMSMPFNSSTPVLYYNKDSFRKAGLDPNKPPRTWAEVAADAAKLKASGSSCGYSTGWQSWVQLENFNAWQGIPFATEDNGFEGTDAKLQIANPLDVKHIGLLAEMAKQGTFTYVGRKDEATAKFFSGDCGIVTTSSGSLANIVKYAKFPFGVSFMPVDSSVKGAPQNAIIGGASLWVMGGQPPEVYKGVAKFLAFLSSPEIAAQWHQDTGYLPVTTAAYRLSKSQGFYDKHPEAEVAIEQMNQKPPLAWTRGLRLGYLPQIRTVIDEELENVWGGKKSPQEALESAVSRGNDLLARFAHTAGQ